MTILTPVPLPIPYTQNATIARRFRCHHHELAPYHGVPQKQIYASLKEVFLVVNVPHARQEEEHWCR